MTVAAPTKAWAISVSDAEFAERRRRAELATREAGLDALIAFSATNQRGPSAFLTGYEPRFGPKDVAVVVLVPGGKATFIAYAYWDEIREMPWLDEGIVKADLLAIGRLIAERLPQQARRIGVVGHMLFPAIFASAIAEARPEARLEDATGLLMNLAMLKSATEIEILRECAAMTDAGVSAFLHGVRDGADEREIGLAVEVAMIRAGADRAAFPPLVFSGPRVETGIGFPVRRRLAQGDQINIVCGALLQSYNMDIGRVTAVGAPSSEMRQVMETAGEMLESMLASARPGAAVARVAAAGVDVVRARGMDEWTYRFGSAAYAGHGIGCWLDEPPRLRAGEEGRIVPGMVLVLEARLGRAGHGGAAITDPVLVTATGIERLSKIPIRTWPS